MKLVRADRPQTKNNYHLLIIEETKYQFIGLRVLCDVYADDYYYSAMDAPLFGEDTESVDVLSYLNKFQSTNYVVTELDDSEVEESTLEIYCKLKNDFEDEHS